VSAPFASLVSSSILCSSRRARSEIMGKRLVRLHGGAGAGAHDQGSGGARRARPIGGHFRFHAPPIPCGGGKQKPAAAAAAARYSPGLAGKIERAESASQLGRPNRTRAGPVRGPGAPGRLHAAKRVLSLVAPQKPARRNRARPTTCCSHCRPLYLAALQRQPWPTSGGGGDSHARAHHQFQFGNF
jgi:hypothetical protein